MVQTVDSSGFHYVVTAAEVYLGADSLKEDLGLTLLVEHSLPGVVHTSAAVELAVFDPLAVKGGPAAKVTRVAYARSFLLGLSLLAGAGEEYLVEGAAVLCLETASGDLLSGLGGDHIGVLITGNKVCDFHIV